MRPTPAGGRPSRRAASGERRSKQGEARSGGGCGEEAWGMRVRSRLRVAIGGVSVELAMTEVDDSPVVAPSRRREVNPRRSHSM